MWALVRTASPQKYEKYQSFLSENFQFLEGKFSIYLNRRVFVMPLRFNFAHSFIEDIFFGRLVTEKYLMISGINFYSFP